MSAYNQVPRLTTTNPLKMHHQHHRHQHGQRDTGPPLMPVDEHEAANYRGGGGPGLGQHTASMGQRKWRVLVSIGLLLPALAAIIGIVAWTISIEVANGGADQMAAASAMAQVRRAERVQKQQQFRRDEAAALAAIIAARRTRHMGPASVQPSQTPAVVQEQPMSAPLIQQQQQQQHQQPQQHEQVAQQSGRSKDNSNNNNDDDDDQKQQQRPAAALRPTRTSQRQVEPTGASQPPATRQQQQQAKRQAVAAKTSESSLVLTNMDQVEMLTSSARDLSSSGGAETSDKPEKLSKNLDKVATMEDEPTKAEASQQASQPAGAQDRDDKMMPQVVAESSQSSASSPSMDFELASDKHDTEPVNEADNLSEATTGSSRQEEAQKSAIEQQKLPDDDELFTNTNNEAQARSRWLAMTMASKSQGSKQHSKSAFVESVSASKKLASAKQNYYLSNSKRHQDRNGAPAPKGLGGAASAKSNSEYRLLSTSPAELESRNQEEDQKEDQENRGREETQQVSRADEEKPASETAKDCSNESKQRQPLEAPSSSSSSSELSRPDDSAANQDEVSFEAIASAISKSLSDNQTSNADQANNSERQDNKSNRADEEAPAARAMAELLSEAIASNKSGDGPMTAPAGSSSLDEEESSSGGEMGGSGDDTQRAKRRRTTGEHLAEVIDHIVEKRHHQRMARFGERSSVSDHHARHPEGPQIVVVAPVGPSGALLKARSLTKEQNVTTTTGGDKAKTSQPTASSKSEGKTQLAAKKQAEPAKKKQQQTKHSSRVVGRLLGIDDAGLSGSSKGEPNQVKYSERVEVIEDDDSSAMLMSQPAIKAPSGSRDIAGESMAEDDIDEEQVAERKSGERNQMGTLTSSQQQADLAAISHEQLSSVHVASHSGQPRSRSPRHEMSSSQMFERYAPLPREPQPQQQQQRPTQQQPKLYSAEQLIMEHVLKSQQRSSNDQQQQRPQVAQSNKQQKQVVAKEQQESISTTAASTTTAASQPSSTARTPTANSQGGAALSRPAQQQQQRQQPDQVVVPHDHSAGENMANAKQYQNIQLQQQQQLEQQANQEANGYAGMQSVQVPALFIQQSGPWQNQQFQRFQLMQQPMQHPQDPYQTMESQQQQVQMVRPAAGYEPEQTSSASASANRQAASQSAELGEQSQQQQQQQQPQQNHRDQQPNQQPQQAQQQQQPQQPQQPQQQQQQLLPVFADQEIQVPAHMAESVIRDLQQAPSTVTGMLNGQPALFQAQPTMMAQVPQQTPHHHQNQHLSEQQMFMQNQQHQHNHHNHPHYQQHMNRLRHQQMSQQMNLAESYQRPMFANMGQQEPNGQQQQQPHSYLRSGYGPLGLVSRLASARRQQLHQQQEQQLQEQMQMQQRERQVFASRASAVAKEDSKQQQQSQEQRGSLIDSVKALGPKGLIQPMAQMALKNLFSSLGEQAMAQQAQMEAAEQRRNQQQSSSVGASGMMAQPASQTENNNNNNAQSSATGTSDSIQASGSSPVGSMAAPMEPPAGRLMRSLPIGAQAPVSQQQLQSIAGDQEVQESYGQMPAYHMPPSGGGGHYPADNYQGDHDKKTKGITFHFGGGPIGGGTQLITSPMGIFKHLMIPLLPNPRVNLNGKVVFGVVLEKSTAFGPPPKKKHKFWG